MESIYASRKYRIPLLCQDIDKRSLQIASSMEEATIHQVQQTALPEPTTVGAVGYHSAHFFWWWSCLEVPVTVGDSPATSTKFLTPATCQSPRRLTHWTRTGTLRDDGTNQYDVFHAARITGNVGQSIELSLRDPVLVMTVLLLRLQETVLERKLRRPCRPAESPKSI